jgi:hypothetical protein
MHGEMPVSIARPLRRLKKRRPRLPCWASERDGRPIFSARPEDHAELARAVTQLDLAAFASVVREMANLATGARHRPTEDLAQIVAVGREGSTGLETSLGPGANDPEGAGTNISANEKRHEPERRLAVRFSPRAA